MKAKLINEKFEQDSDPIHDMSIGDPLLIAAGYMQRYAEKNGFKFDFNKNDTPYIEIPVNYEMIRSYDQLSWPTKVLKIRYTVTLIESRDDKYSLRKIWYGYEPDTGDYWDFLGDYDKNKNMFKKFRRDLNKQHFSIKNLKQSLMGRFVHPSDIMNRIDLSVKKELKNKKIY
jgi:hypothetical protein